MTENSTPKNNLSSTARLKKLMEEEKKPVTGIFRFHECPGGETIIPMKKYEGDVKTFHLKDGEEYTVPLWVARWLNGYDATAGAVKGKINSCAYSIHEHCVDRYTGLPSIKIGQVRRRMSFESNEFMTA